MCSPFPLATGSLGDSHALGASDPLAATCCDHADPATRPAAGPRAHQWCRGVFVSAGFVVCGCCFVLKPASRLARSAASMLCIGAARRDSGSWPLPLLQDPVVMQAMARVVVRSELGIEEIDLVWGERVSVNTRGAAEVLVEAGSDASISLDRRSLDPFRRAGHGVVTATLKPALVVGARRLEVREGRRAASVDFAAEEALALGAEFRAMVEIVESDLPRLRGSFWYLDHERRLVRAASPARVATFLMDHAQAIQQAVRRIASDPTHRHEHVRRLAPGGPAVDVAATLALVRRRPELLEAIDPGVVRVDGVGRAPSMVVVRRAQRDVSTPENRRLAAFLQRLWRDCRRVEHLLDDPDAIAQLNAVRTGLGHLLHDTFLREVVGTEGDDAVLDPIGAESDVEDYARLHALRVAYLTKTNPGADVSALERQHTARADEIFQAFACYIVAEALDLEPVGAGLRDRDGVGASFPRARVGTALRHRRGDALLVSVILSQPDDYRPDIVLRRVADPRRKVIVLDVKYSVNAVTHRPPNERLKEVQAYMQSFRVPPGSAFSSRRRHSDEARDAIVHDVAAGGYLMRELPVRGLGFDVVRTLPVLRGRLLELEGRASPPHLDEESCPPPGSRCGAEAPRETKFKRAGALLPGFFAPEAEGSHCRQLDEDPAVGVLAVR